MFNRSGFKLRRMGRRQIDELESLLNLDDIPVVALYQVPLIADLTPTEKSLLDRLVPEGGDDDPIFNQELLDSFLRLAGDTRPEPLPLDEVEPDDGALDRDGPPSKVQMNGIAEFMKDDLELALKFKGYYAIQWAWLMWLQDHLPADTFCLYDRQQWRGMQREYLQWDPDAPGVAIDERFIDEIKRCRAEQPDTRFVVGILGVPDHANAMIFDFVGRTLTRFEPHGGRRSFYNQDTLDGAIRYELIAGNGRIGLSDVRPFKDDEKLFLGWEYIAPSDVCLQGPQTIEGASALRLEEEKGYCAAWSMIYLHHRVLNPDQSDNEVLAYFTERGSDELLRLIRGYAAYVMDLVGTGAVEANPELEGALVSVVVSEGFAGYGRIARVTKKNYDVILLKRTRSEIGRDSEYIGWRLSLDSMTPVTDPGIHRAWADVWPFADKDYYFEMSSRSWDPRMISFSTAEIQLTTDRGPRLIKERFIDTAKAVVEHGPRTPYGLLSMSLAGVPEVFLQDPSGKDRSLESVVLRARFATPDGSSRWYAFDKSVRVVDLVRIQFILFRGFPDDMALPARPIEVQYVLVSYVWMDRVRFNAEAHMIDLLDMMMPEKDREWGERGWALFVKLLFGLQFAPKGDEQAYNWFEQTHPAGEEFDERVRMYARATGEDPDQFLARAHRVRQSKYATILRRIREEPLFDIPGKEITMYDIRRLKNQNARDPNVMFPIVFQQGIRSDEMKANYVRMPKPSKDF